MMIRRYIRKVLGVMGAAAMLVLAPQASQAQLARVGWTQVVSTQSGECLDSQGTAFVQSPCGSTPSQLWAIEPNANGFVVVQKQSARCLTASGTSVVQGACGGGGDTWTITAVGNAVRLMSATSQLCLVTAGGSTASGAAMSLGACTAPTVPTWAFQSGLVMPNQLATFQADNSGQCMTIGTSYNVIQNPCSGTPFEQWYLLPTKKIYQYMVVLGASGFCLNAPAATVGTAMTIVSCNPNASTQMFTFVASTPGYLIVLPFTSMCLDVSGASTASGKPIVVAACNGAKDELWSLSTASVPSKWTGLVPLNNDPMAVANLPDGTLLTWTANSLYNFEGDIGAAASQTYYSVFSPATSTSGTVRTDSASADMFCPGTANLADGRILVNGGSSSTRTTIYDPATHLFAADANMTVPRGYEGDTPLSNGSVLTLGGSWSGGVGGKNGEVWTKGQGWTKLAGVPDDPFLSPDFAPNFYDNHLWLFAFNGFVLHAGPGPQMHWIFTSGSGAVYSAGTRGDDAYSINGNAVMYDVGKILKVGGAPLYTGAAATGAAYTITIGSGVNVDKVAPMTYARAFSNGVTLPNGQVLVAGGQTYAQTFSDSNAVLIPELWDPATGVFQQLAPMQTGRTYHSTAILLNDGRVFVGGGWQCGYNCTPDHYNAEILSPPYLLNADGSAATRPTITSAPTSASLGATLSVKADSPVASFVLMRNSSVTHSVNNDQRRIPLTMQSAQPGAAGNTYTLAIPADPGTVLPGYYMLFALNAYGVPSVSTSLLVH